MAYVFLVGAFVINALASIFLKMNAERAAPITGLNATTITGNGYLILALFLFATNVLLYYFALRAIPLSVAYPIMVTGTFIIVGLSSLFVFHEHITSMQLVGYLFVIGGITLVSIFS